LTGWLQAGVGFQAKCTRGQVGESHFDRLAGILSIPIRSCLILKCSETEV